MLLTSIYQWIIGGLTMAMVWLGISYWSLNGDYASLKKDYSKLQVEKELSDIQKELFKSATIKQSKAIEAGAYKEAEHTKNITRDIIKIETVFKDRYIMIQDLNETECDAMKRIVDEEFNTSI